MSPEVSEHLFGDLNSLWKWGSWFLQHFLWRAINCTEHTKNVEDGEQTFNMLSTVRVGHNCQRRCVGPVPLLPQPSQVQWQDPHWGCWKALGVREAGEAWAGASLCGQEQAPMAHKKNGISGGIIISLTDTPALAFLFKYSVFFM